MFADYSRYTASGRRSAAGRVPRAWPLTSLWFMPLGTAGRRGRRAAPTRGPCSARCGCGAAGAVLMALGTLTTNFVNIYLSALAWKSLCPSTLRRRSVWSIGLVGSRPGPLSRAWLDRYGDLMLVLGGLLVPVGGILLARFFWMSEAVDVRCALSRTAPRGRARRSVAWALGAAAYYAASALGGTLPVPGRLGRQLSRSWRAEGRPAAAASRSRSPAATRPCRRPRPPTGSRSRPGPGPAPAPSPPATARCSARMVAPRGARPGAWRPGRGAGRRDMSATSAVSRATSVPRRPMAIPTSAVASAGASLTPSPTMATGPQRALRLARSRSTLSSGRRSACAVRDAEARRQRARGARVVPGQHGHVDAQRRAAPRTAAAASGRTASADRRPRPAGRAVSPAADQHGRLALALQAQQVARRAGGRRGPARRSSRWLPTSTSRPAHAAAARRGRGSR